MSTPAQPVSQVDSLTDRQKQVLRMVARGATNPEVAAALDVSLDGAKWHLREIFAKLGVDSREEAAEAWRAHRALPARGRRALRAIFGLAALKVAAGAAAV
ncbi:MAG: helix-turn-helix transcriptional regulator, partial [Dehalococcoidia bacterium]